MKLKYLFVLVALIAAISSCTTQKNVPYFQDLTEEGSVAMLANQYLQIRKGDKLAINVHSAATPDQAVRYAAPIYTLRGVVSSGSQYQTVYTVDENGYVSVPGLTPVKAEGLTRTQLTEKLEEILRAGILKDAVVTVDCYDRYITILGEVNRPGRINVTNDYMTILEALGAAGDLNIQAMRNEIVVLRKENGELKNYFVDLRSKDMMSSPAFYLQPEDVIYVKPNKYRRGQSTVNDNSLRSISTWLSVASVLTSITILITNAVRK